MAVPTPQISSAKPAVRGPNSKRKKGTRTVRKVASDAVDRAAAGVVYRRNSENPHLISRSFGRN